MNEDFFETRSDLEEGNIYILTKVNRILNGNLMREWKELQEQKL